MLGEVGPAPRNEKELLQRVLVFTRNDLSQLHVFVEMLLDGIRGTTPHAYAQDDSQAAQ